EDIRAACINNWPEHGRPSHHNIIASVPVHVGQTIEEPAEMRWIAGSAESVEPRSSRAIVNVGTARIGRGHDHVPSTVAVHLPQAQDAAPELTAAGERAQQGARGTVINVSP